jgi:hypothetical protein
MNKKAVCCFCGDEIGKRKQYNPYPADTTPGAVCCNLCNKTIVLESRRVLNRTPIEFRNMITSFKVVDGYAIVNVAKKDNEKFKELCPIAEWIDE